MVCETKNGEPARDSPVLALGVLGLESQTESELKLAHADGRARGGVCFDVGNLAGAATAIHATIEVVADAENWVVEDVVRVEAELRFDTLGDAEALRERQVVVEGMGSAIRIEADVADLTASGQREGTRSWTGSLALVILTGDIRWRIGDFR